MTKFRFSAIINGVEYVKEAELPEQTLEAPSTLSPDWQRIYRENIIKGRLNKFALSLFNLSWEEVKQDEGNADCTDSSITQSKTTKGAS